MPLPLLHRPLRHLAVVALACAGTLAAAQADKSIAVESAPAFPALERWVTTVVVVVPEAPPAPVQPVPVAPPPAAPAGTDYQPLPVILGVPDLPLMGAGASATAKAWGAELNYQGAVMRQVVLDARGTRHLVRPMSARIKAGERFKIRVTPTFDGVADIDLVTGDTWSLRRIGQFYPAKGLSVQVKAGETIELPVGAGEYFVMARPGVDRLVVSLRHHQATGAARSAQPAYRQDGKAASSYLQLVPRGTFPVIEQLVSQAR